MTDSAIATRMQKRVGLCNIAVHANQALSLDMVNAVMERRLDDFQSY